MPKKGRRSVEVRGQTYSYVLKGGKGRYQGQSGPTMRLVVELNSKKYVSATFRSKHFDEDAEAGLKSHKVIFSPWSVTRVVEAALDNDGRIPKSFELTDWRVARPGDL